MPCNICFCFRNQIRGLRAQHQKDIAKLKQVLSDPSPKSFENGKTSEKNTSDALKPIGFASTWHHTKNGTPRQGVIAKMSNGCIGGLWSFYVEGTKLPRFYHQNGFLN